ESNTAAAFLNRKSQFLYTTGK
ncbi:toxin, partial [Escherichia coli]|nr:toxin [Escherichia coli]EFJ2600999.1 toxin [Escherichia coli O6:H34]EJR5704111.1 toxin [Shigella sonnei]EFP1848426.1 toxin [Escherichia coli]EIP6338558.1 toxin [Escherichia coli]